MSYFLSLRRTHDFVYRKIASHMFKVKELKHMRDIFERHGQELLQILDKAADTGKPIDVADLFFRSAPHCPPCVHFMPFGSLQPSQIHA